MTVCSTRLPSWSRTRLRRRGCGRAGADLSNTQGWRPWAIRRSRLLRRRAGSLRPSLFFLSSRRRHTTFDCDWSSDVCSSDLAVPADQVEEAARRALEPFERPGGEGDRKSVVGGKGVEVGGSRSMKKKKLS